MKVFNILAASCLVLAAAGFERDQIRIAGSSTVFPFTSFVAEEFGANKANKTPIVESVGTGGGFKLFCSGLGGDTPDIANASRPIKLSEFELCQKNGVTDISGIMIGYDGIVLAQNTANGELSLSKEQIFKALAKDIFLGGKLVPNPYKSWKQIDESLPDREIVVYGPPSTSGTRDSFEELVMQEVSEKLGYDKGYKAIREDGVFVPSGENDNLIVAKLGTNKAALGIFGYSYFEENADKLTAVSVDGVALNAQNIANGSYKVARSLFIYVKNAHKGSTKGLEDFIKLYISDDMIGENGELRTLGLIPQGGDELKRTREFFSKPLDMDLVKAHKVN
ncbi:MULTISPECIES: PstS family phosphate ABC transporter substrate-binding protein [Campylobacter]|uniref:PstS family phosphate ABC transporter substrate-binding protein n=1 Tax=Campylobacter TaxID=194 RepID=UPI001475D857|nr:PstS family phosphate ABC transporter substrate-binding protein [Campylobacter sp. RM12916]MBE3022786.1 PstS family phosphate ABC transporter substrate-binding protein [Campylobacter sp. 7477a]MBE3610407.1 PstS family phosphate ABC transporter substrate-binding protein [Campylobacter sp. RM12916]